MFPCRLRSIFPSADCQVWKSNQPPTSYRAVDTILTGGSEMNTSLCEAGYFWRLFALIDNPGVALSYCWPPAFHTVFRISVSFNVIDSRTMICGALSLAEAYRMSRPSHFSISQDFLFSWALAPFPLLAFTCHNSPSCSHFSL